MIAGIATSAVWISVDDAMPMHGEEVLTWDGTFIQIGSYDIRVGRAMWHESHEYLPINVTHWALLPATPPTA